MQRLTALGLALALVLGSSACGSDAAGNQNGDGGNQNGDGGNQNGDGGNNDGAVGGPDDDGDGVPNDRDLCPDQLEDYNNQDDADGCPDENVTPTRVRVLDESGHQISPSVVDLSAGPEADSFTLRDGELVRSLVPGRYQVTASAPGYEPLSVVMDLSLIHI